VRSDPRSGQLVRTVTIAPRVVESRVVAPQEFELEVAVRSSPSEVRTMIEEVAKTYEVSPDLVDSVIQVESNYNPRAVSPKGALGIMQLMPETARRFGVKNAFDPKQNIEGGVRYLKFLQDIFKDDRLAIAAYNAGEGAVQKYGNVPPYPETMNYVANVGRKYGQARRAQAAKRAEATAAEIVPKPPEYRRLAQHVDAEGRVYLTTQ
jgi:soluble lytic murein transglycosylase-like protein